MSEQYLINGQTLTDIADAIRGQSGETGSIKAGEFAGKILELEITASGSNYVEGVYRGEIGSNDYIQIPKPSFQPKTIVASSVVPLDYGEDFQAYGGFMYTAFYDEDYGQWIVAGPRGSSGIIYIHQESAAYHHIVPNTNSSYLYLYIIGCDSTTDREGKYVCESDFKVRIYG